jgi:hypothetical protein
MSCSECADVIDRTDVPHVIRECACGRELHVVEPGDHGKGIRIRAGDRFTIPAGWLTFSLNPLKSHGRLSRAGIDMLANQLFLENIQGRKESIWEHLLEVERRTDSVVSEFPPLHGLDVNKEDDFLAIVDILQQHKESKENFAFWAGSFLASARAARDTQDLDTAIWSIAFAERCLSMMKFKEALEDVVWMGHSVARLRDVLAIWDTSQDNALEEFWQETFKENSFVLSQVFAEPLVFIQDKAYVGGMRLDRSDARFVDYLFSVESSREAVLIEIKTPTTPLIGGEYRGHRMPSRELVGSIMQVSNYRAELVQSLKTLTPDTRLEAFAPRCVVILGNGTRELANAADRRSFDLYRASLRDVQVITYDELFRKVEVLIDLFGLKRIRTSDSG